MISVFRRGSFAWRYRAPASWTEKLSRMRSTFLFKIYRLIISSCKTKYLPFFLPIGRTANQFIKPPKIINHYLCVPPCCAIMLPFNWRRGRINACSTKRSWLLCFSNKPELCFIAPVRISCHHNGNSIFLLFLARNFSCWKATIRNEAPEKTGLIAIISITEFILRRCF